ncbi:hypothetical protein EST38_g265 [Candolleomyces aberdarensis]|uniref:Mitochondrial carrier n=1 Tax=Candolleomyces aberdarensis TaxID=2316362 RepID=A0A4Q2E149_9AGAR|nr:hypothetical protein EST38_g265 [Candolleomyces aberdarensis]
MASLGFFGIVFLFVTLAISLAIVIPFSGVLVRFRANFNPKGLRLDEEGSTSPPTGPVVKSYFAMFQRVYRIEGWPGLYKGLMPTALSTFTVTVFVLAVFDPEKPRRHSKYAAPDTGILGTLVYSILMLLVSLPATILTYRAITTPVKLGYFNGLRALRILLTPTERRRPWILYLTPGLMAAEILHITAIVLALGPLRRLLLPSLRDTSGFKELSVVKVAIYTIVAIACTAILTPLEVITTRLVIQRNHASAEYNSVQQEVEGDSETQEEYGNEEEVIGLREEGDPYLGLVDCAKRIIDEEGLSTLYRAWWLTLFGIWANAFV